MMANGQSVSPNTGTQNGTRTPLLSRLPEEVPARSWGDTYTEDLHHAYRLIAAHVYRFADLGRFAYAAFDWINATYFEGKLPETLLLWDLTDYGRCLGWCRSAADGPPIIKLHPATVQPRDRPNYRHAHVWGYPLDWFGLCFAFDTLLHECVHASVNYLLGGWEGLPGVKSYWTCHNNPLWVGELNRIAPRLGYAGDPFTMKTPQRVPIPGVFTKTGKPRTRTARRQDGEAPDFERFPHSLPCRAPFYLAGKLPFPWGRKRPKRGVVSPSSRTPGSGRAD
jgi:hypothetical protein